MKIDFDLLPTTVGIVGSRDFPRLQMVTDFVNGLKPGTLVVSGGARGVDGEAATTARQRDDLPEPEEYLPDKKLPVPARFFMRNTEIVKHVQRERGIVFAFLIDPPKTGGTQDTLNKCDKAAVPWVSFHMTGKGKWLEPRVSPAIVLSLKWQEILFGSPQSTLIAY